MSFQESIQGFERRVPAYPRNACRALQVRTNPGSGCVVDGDDKNAVSRLETAGKHAPPLLLLRSMFRLSDVAWKSSWFPALV